MWIAIAAVNLAIAVALGAFGAHGLKKMVGEQQLMWWSTATDYFFIHALGLLMIGIILKLKLVEASTSAILLQAGIVIFCGSLYAMTLGAPKWFGAITPIGGVLFIAGWAWLAYKAL